LRCNCRALWVASRANFFAAAVVVDGEDIEVGIKRERLGDFEVAFDIESFVLIPSRPSTELVSLSLSVSNIRLSESKEPATCNIAQQGVFCQEKLLFALDKL
jgi:hypothetical protein